MERQIQTAKNLTQETKDILQDAGTKLGKQTALKLSRLAPEQQEEAASMLATGQIRSVEQYTAGKSGEPNGARSIPADNPKGEAAPQVGPVSYTHLLTFSAGVDRCIKCFHLSHQQDPPLGTGDCCVEQVPRQQDPVGHQQGDNHGVVFRSLRLMDGRGIGQRQFAQTIQRIVGIAFIKVDDDLACCLLYTSALP